MRAVLLPLYPSPAPPLQDADDTAAAADIPEAAAHADAHMSEEGADAEPRGTPQHPASATIAGLTPMMDQAATPGVINRHALVDAVDAAPG